MQNESDLAKAFRAARDYGSGPGRRPARLALMTARKALAAVAEAEAAYMAANPLSADPAASGALPIDAAAGHAARSAYVAARSRAGLYASHPVRRYPAAIFSEDGTALFVQESGAYPFRSIRPADECEGGPDNNGWYDNPWNEGGGRARDGLIFGVVAQLSGRDGKPRYLAGWQSGSCEGGPTLATGRGYFDSERDAASYADGLAERAAEAERDYQAAWAAGTRWAELGETVAQLRAEGLALAKERRAARRYLTQQGEAWSVTCATVRARIKAIWAEMAEARAERKEAAEGYHTNREAWADGADLSADEAEAVAYA